MPEIDVWIERLLAGFDPGWLVDEDVPEVDRRSRSGILRISTDDLVDRLDRIYAFYGRERGKLVNVCRGKLGEFAGDAEDVVQDVMCRIAARPPELRDPDKLSSYVYTAIYNEISDRGRRSSEERRRRSSDEDALDVAGPGSAFEDVVVFHLVMARALALLTPQQRRMVVLVDVRRFTVQDAAAELGIAVGTAKRHRFDALHRLRDDPGLAPLRPTA